MLLVGAGQGLALAPLTSSGGDGVAPADAGAVSGLINTVHQIGSALSLSILTAVATTIRPGHGATDIAARSGAALTGSEVHTLNSGHVVAASRPARSRLRPHAGTEPVPSAWRTRGMNAWAASPSARLWRTFLGSAVAGIGYRS